MFRYFYRLYDKFDRKISAYAIFTEANSIPRPDTFKLKFLDTELTYKFNAYKITEPTEQELNNSDNPFALVILAARSAFIGRNIHTALERDMLIKDLKIALLKKLFDKRIDKKKRDAIWNFINFHIKFELEETTGIFKEELNSLTKNKEHMGIEEQILELVNKRGVEQGVEKGQTQVHEKLGIKLIHKFGYTDKQAADFLEVPIQFVRDLRKKLNHCINSYRPG